MAKEQPLPEDIEQILVYIAAVKDPVKTIENRVICVNRMTISKNM